MCKIYQKIYPERKNPSAGILGFTLIELLVVVFIVGLLSAAALPLYKTAVLKARYVQTRTAAAALAQAKQRYVLANGEEAADMNHLDIRLGNCEISEDGTHCGGAYYCYMSGYCMSMAGGHEIGHMVNRRGSFCMARMDSTQANAACKSLGGVFDENFNGINYYLMSR